MIEAILERIRESLVMVLTKEAENDKWLRQTILGSKWRAIKGFLAVIKDCFWDVVNIATLAIANHRQEEHGDDETATIEKASRSLDGAEATTAENFWN